MWNSIESIPDHSLIFYINCKKIDACKSAYMSVATLGNFAPQSCKCL